MKEQWRKARSKQEIDLGEKDEILEIRLKVYKWEKEMDSGLFALKERMCKEEDV